MPDMFCKFCGKKIDAAKYLHVDERSCGECTSYCMKVCELNKKSLLSWHREPCKSCPENPYNKYKKGDN